MSQIGLIWERTQIGLTSTVVIFESDIYTDVPSRILIDVYPNPGIGEGWQLDVWDGDTSNVIHAESVDDLVSGIIAAQIWVGQQNHVTLIGVD